MLRRLCRAPLDGVIEPRSHESSIYALSARRHEPLAAVELLRRAFRGRDAAVYEIRDLELRPPVGDGALRIPRLSP